MSHSQFTALALAVATIAVSGCGGSSNTSSTTGASTTTGTSNASGPSTETTSAQGGKSLTSAQLIAKADAICARINAKRATITIHSRQELPVLKVLANYEQLAANELSKLVPPPPLQDDWKQIVASAEAVAYDTGKYSELSMARNAAAGCLATAGTVTLQKMTTVAKRDGFKECDKAS